MSQWNFSKGYVLSLGCERLFGLSCAGTSQAPAVAVLQEQARKELAIVHPIHTFDDCVYGMLVM